MRRRENWNWCHSGGDVKQCSGNFLGIIRVTLARTPNNRVYGDGTVYLCNQAGLLMVGLGINPSNETLSLHPVMTARCARAMVAQSLRVRLVQNQT